MFGCVYTFESEGAHDTEQTVSTDVGRAIDAAINGRVGIRYQELTDPGNPKPMFAILFPDSAQKELFDGLFEPALKLSRLHVSAARALAIADPAEPRKPDIGYIDRERGYAIFIPTMRLPIDGEA